ncbi:Asp-tRNA(Asn)/Glu-tRNA(Gln) amidotransferase subunit GatC [Amphibiibacter pelophylacis]|uniref:Asp-tRNA(Asn)/Glu-tRNA(Gln) amidotransferase subunit GatC n=1 Tax=Amphibiibacter pelophylacis TaxID=1799477 RepID=A0ACC6P6F9_9BURK
MSASLLDRDDVSRLAQLARLQFTPEASQRLQDQMNAFFAIVEQMQQVDTTGVAPLSTPLAASLPLAGQSADLRLRDDAITVAPHGETQLAAHLRNAPARSEGLILVPPVIE